MIDKSTRDLGENIWRNDELELFKSDIKNIDIQES